MLSHKLKTAIKRSHISCENLFLKLINAVLNYQLVQSVTLFYYGRMKERHINVMEEYIRYEFCV